MYVTYKFLMYSWFEFSLYSMFLGALPMVRASVYCLPYFLQWLIVIGYAGGSILGLVKVNNSFNTNLVQLTYL